MTEEISFRACRHEAGHAVMAILLGHDVRGISVEKAHPHTNIPALERGVSARDRALIALAGNAAEAILDWHLRGEVGPLEVLRDLRDSDLHNFELAMSNDPGMNKLGLSNEAWGLLKRSNRALGVLARALAKRGSMSGREVYETLGITPPIVETGTVARQQQGIRTGRTYRTAGELRGWARELRAAGNERLAEFIQHRVSVLEGREPPRIERVMVSVAPMEVTI